MKSFCGYGSILLPVIFNFLILEMVFYEFVIFNTVPFYDVKNTFVASFVVKKLSRKYCLWFWDLYSELFEDFSDAASYQLGLAYVKIGLIMLFIYYYIKFLFFVLSVEHLLSIGQNGFIVLSAFLRTSPLDFHN